MENATSCPSLKPNEYKSGTKPVWCPGCGDYSVLLSITKAMSELNLEPENVALVSGIGCSSRLPAYLNVYGFHAVHGRALPVATGLKVSRPDLTVLAAGGDGDGFSIGGNHFMHACRRNVDMTYIVMDNQVYGMTKGQASPTTDPDWDKSKLTPGGTKINPYYPLVIALASGANFIARASSTDPNGAAKVLVDAIRHPGFSFVHMLSPCVTFRPEQKEWKKMVRPAPVEPTTDAAVAAKRLMTDDNFFLGTLYKGNRAAYQPELKSTVEHLSELEQGFIL
jgi:2-oxoglutarate ferredoxin oxidoreductase subunit beta